MSRHKRHSTHDEVGHDAFLDIVANLVGILVILIMVLGVRAQDAYENAMVVSVAETSAPAPKIAPPTPISDELTAAIPAEEIPKPEPELPLAIPTHIEPPPPLPDVETPKVLAKSIQADAHAIDQHVQFVHENIRLHEIRRNRLLLQISEREQAIAEQNAELSQKELVARQIQSELAAAQRTLAHLQQQQTLFQSQTAESTTEIIEHHPTPLAKKVLGESEYFQMADGRIAYVPANGMLDELKKLFKQQLWKLKESASFTDVLPARDSFYMKYTFRRSNKISINSNGPVQTLELDHCLILPERDNLGEPFTEAFQPNSEFMQRLATFDPNDITIRLVVYPECFEAFQTLKKILWKRGYSVSTLPLPKGNPLIIGGPSSATVDAAAQ